MRYIGIAILIVGIAILSLGAVLLSETIAMDKMDVCYQGTIEGDEASLIAIANSVGGGVKITSCCNGKAIADVSLVTYPEIPMFSSIQVDEPLYMTAPFYYEAPILLFALGIACIGISIVGIGVGNYGRKGTAD